MSLHRNIMLVIFMELLWIEVNDDMLSSLRGFFNNISFNNMFGILLFEKMVHYFYNWVFNTFYEHRCIVFTVIFMTHKEIRSFLKFFFIDIILLFMHGGQLMYYLNCFVYKMRLTLYTHYFQFILFIYLFEFNLVNIFSPHYLMVYFNNYYIY